MIPDNVTKRYFKEVLGHADISITLRVYAYVTPTMQQVAADVMDSMFAVKEE
jgi:hypothetical protein